MRTHLLAIVTALGFAACSSGPECPADETPAGPGCVPAVFADVRMDPIAEADLVVDPTDPDQTHARGTIVVALEDPSLPAADREALFAGADVTGEIPFAGIYRLRYPEDDERLDARIDLFLDNPAIAVAMRDYATGVLLGRADTDLEKVVPGMTAKAFFDDGQIINPDAGPADSAAYTRIHIPEAWQLLYDKNPVTDSIVVAVPDGPVAHDPVFSESWVNAHDLRLTGGDLTTLAETRMARRHATAIASILAAPNDQKGMNGILKGLGCLHSGLAPIVFSDTGTLDPATGKASPKTLLTLSLASIVLSVKSGAKVVSMSWGIERAVLAKLLPKLSWDKFRRLFTRLFQAAPGVLFVAAAGNSGGDAAAVMPCDAATPTGDWFQPNVVCVSGLAKDADTAGVWPGSGSSNRNPTTADGGQRYPVTLAAPGTDVIAHLPSGDLTFFYGTSAAAPLVAGVAGLVYSVNKDFTGYQVRGFLESSAVDIGDAPLGRRVDALAALGAAIAALPPDRVGKGTCRPPDPPPPTTGHNPVGAAWLRMEVVCDGCRGVVPNSHIVFGGEKPRVGWVDDKCFIGSYCADIWLLPGVQLTPVSAPGAKFLRWEGTCAGSDVEIVAGDSIAVPMTHEQNCRAVFDR